MQQRGVRLGEAELGRRQVLGHRIGRAIREAGLSQKVVAAQLGVQPGIVSRWVLGQRPVPMPVLAQIGRLTGVTTDTLLDADPDADLELTGPGECPEVWVIGEYHTPWLRVVVMLTCIARGSHDAHVAPDGVRWWPPAER
jgi:transcriptional regulator with XRE-family HTH domain